MKERKRVALTMYLQDIVELARDIERDVRDINITEERYKQINLPNISKDTYEKAQQKYIKENALDIGSIAEVLIEELNK